MTSGVILALDWNGTTVDDAGRAFAAVLVAGVPRPPRSLDAFRDGFRLPLPAWFASLGVPASQLPAVERAWTDEMCRHPAALSPGAEQLLAWCTARALPVRVLTGAATRLIEADAARLAVRPLIDQVITAHPKSDLLRRWQAGGHQVVYVGDTEYDMAEAHRAGAAAVGFAGGYRSEASLIRTDPAAVVHDLTEVIPLLDLRVAQTRRRLW